MNKCGVLLALLFAGVIMTTRADHPSAPEAGVKPLNVLGGPDQHASFSFIRPGLTQTSYSFNGPSSHQSFSSSIGNPDLSQKVYPSIAQALAYRNPGLGLGAFANSPISGAYASPTPYNFPAVQSYQQDPAAAAAAPGYFQPQDYQGQYQAQLAQVLASRQAQLLQLQQLQAQAQQSSFPSQHQVVPEQIDQQQQHQPQNLLGVAYSAAPSVAHVKVSGNGYKFNF